MLQLHELDQLGLSLVSALLCETPHSDAGVDPLPFRAKHYENVKEIDWLESVGYIRKETERYHVGLAAIAQMPDERAVKLLADAEILFAELRRHYKQTQREAAKLVDLVAATSLEPGEVRETLSFMVEGQWCGGRSISFYNDSQPIVHPSEAILGYETFGDVIRQIHQWQASRIRDRQLGLANALRTFLPLLETQKLDPQRVRQKPDWINSLQPTLMRLLVEIYGALAIDLRALPTMGVRAVIDVVCVDLVGDVGTFEKKIWTLAKQGYILERERSVLIAVVEAGNATVHRGHTPTPEDLQVLLDIVEQLLYRQYIQTDLAKRVEANTPPRAPKR